jgi:hypothetical protein
VGPWCGERWETEEQSEMREGAPSADICENPDGEWSGASYMRLKEAMLDCMCAGMLEGMFDGMLFCMLDMLGCMWDMFAFMLDMFDCMVDCMLDAIFMLWPEYMGWVKYCCGYIWG